VPRGSGKARHLEPAKETTSEVRCEPQSYPVERLLLKNQLYGYIDSDNNFQLLSKPTIL
jgi:hypothetical protein